MVEESLNIVNQFNIDGILIDVKPITNGNINKTYIATFKMSSGDIKKFVVQRINTTVFKEPYKVMKNITNITKWIKEKSISAGDLSHPFLEVIPTKNNSSLATILDEDDEKQYYRAYNCIEDSISYDNSKDERVIFNAGKAFGHFQKMLDGYPVETVEDTIEDFHNTPKRYNNFIKDVNNDVCGRVNEVLPEIDFFVSNSNVASIITDLMSIGRIPTRITHNDTKVNNVMLDKKTGDFLTVIDLDTVMLGSYLYDYGDGVRSAASNALEDDENLNNVYLLDNLFEVYTNGYLSEISPHLTKDEVYNLGNSIEVITYELGLRFLNDYINGDTYFKTTKDKHNLIRARNQIQLLKDIQSKKKYVNDYILTTYNENIKKLGLKNNI